jgi:hypothetical protein
MTEKPWKLLYFESFEPEKRIEIENFYRSIYELDSGMPPFGVVSELGEIVAVNREFNVCSRRGFLNRFGPGAWTMCTMPGLRVPNVPRMAKKETGPRPVRRKKLMAKVTAFMAAVTGPKTDDETYEKRLAICSSNECGHLKTKGEKLFCGACGCPKWTLAELTTKLRFSQLECPCEPPLWTAAAKED